MSLRGMIASVGGSPEPVRKALEARPAHVLFVVSSDSRSQVEDAILTGRNYMPQLEYFSVDQLQKVIDKFGQPENGTYKLGVRNLFEIMKFSEDNSFHKSVQIYDSLTNHLTKRNNSLLAHGLQPVKREAFQSFWESALLAFDLGDTDIPRWPQLKLKLPPTA